MGEVDRGEGGPRAPGVLLEGGRPPVAPLEHERPHGGEGGGGLGAEDRGVQGEGDRLGGGVIDGAPAQPRRAGDRGEDVGQRVLRRRAEGEGVAHRAGALGASDGVAAAHVDMLGGDRAPLETRGAGRAAPGVPSVAGADGLVTRRDVAHRPAEVVPERGGVGRGGDQAPADSGGAAGEGVAEGRGRVAERPCAALVERVVEPVPHLEAARGAVAVGADPVGFRAGAGAGDRRKRGGGHHVVDRVPGL